MGLKINLDNRTEFVPNLIATRKSNLSARTRSLHAPGSDFVRLPQLASLKVLKCMLEQTCAPQASRVVGSSNPDSLVSFIHNSASAQCRNFGTWFYNLNNSEGGNPAAVSISRT